jgi:hypothetical protein
MTDLFYGGELDSVKPSDANCFEFVAGDTYDSDRARTGIIIFDETGYAESPTFAAQTEVWFHWRSYLAQQASTMSCPVIAVVGGASEMVRLLYTYTTSPLMSVQWNNAGTWTTLATATGINFGVLQTFDLYVNKTTGVIKFYSSGSLAVDTSATLSGFSDITKCRWYGASSTNEQYISELCASTASTIGMAIFTIHPTGNGANTAWTGAYTEVDEIPYSDADGISTTSANDIETFTGPSPSLGNYVVRGVGVDARAKVGATGPTQLQLVTRVNGSNYFSSTKTLGSGYAPVVNVWETNPDTTAVWEAADALALEFGVKAIA